jgi:phosphatidylglycerophosphate synthase
VALGLWLANRLLDGLDGPTARAGSPTDAGGFLDIVADFSIYAGIILGLAVAVPGARLACVALLTAYYISGTAFLALSSLAERRRQRLGDNRSLRFVGGLAEGTETIAVYLLLFLLPQHATPIVWAFTAAVAITAAQRILTGLRLLGAPARAEPAGTPAAAAGGGPQRHGAAPVTHEEPAA